MMVVSTVCRQVARKLACVEVVQTTTHRLPLALRRLRNNKGSLKGAENPADKMQLRLAWISMLVQVGLCGIELVTEDQPLSNTDFLWEPE